MSLPSRHLTTSQSRLKSTIYVAGLDNAVDTNTLADVFLPFGEIADVTLPKPELPSSTDAHRGFGYVEFEIPGDAKEAIDNMDQSELYGRVIKVAQAKPQKDSNEGLGSKTAVWEQVTRPHRVGVKGANNLQEGYLAKHAVGEEERLVGGQVNQDNDTVQELEGLSMAGPQPA